MKLKSSLKKGMNKRAYKKYDRSFRETDDSGYYEHKLYKVFTQGKLNGYIDKYGKIVFHMDGFGHQDYPSISFADQGDDQTVDLAVKMFENFLGKFVTGVNELINKNIESEIKGIESRFDSIEKLIGSAKEIIKEEEVKTLYTARVVEIITARVNEMVTGKKGEGIFSFFTKK